MGQYIENKTEINTRRCSLEDMENFNSYTESWTYWIPKGICLEDVNDYQLYKGAHDVQIGERVAMRWEIKPLNISKEEIDKFVSNYSIGFFMNAPQYQKAMFGDQTINKGTAY